jgi:2'-5' RNA ligase
MKYLVALPLTEPSATRVAQFKQRYRQPGWRDTMPPHLTLLPPSRPALSPVEASAHFNRLPELPQIEVTFSRIEVFSRHQRSTVVVTPSQTEPLAELFALLVSLATWQDLGPAGKRPFVPHVTIVNQANSLTRDEALDQLSLELLPLNIGFESMTLYMKEAKWPEWQALSQVKLFKSAAAAD